ncbi:RnfABCDGE type electron transport complex subunit G [Roseburia sp. MSJ-14]|uniref:RnfABCDGE type electron transport complex subunit G n=1 Tax=Roseburia sp. MSJ-14 TaxID=2841514 RepID=UPI001C0FF432|nr:RnfABCDGE type electron transport complex subunit G [Roseburia sp. MSJ-14]MBU5472836.1 RnfABCDGE type electron transport complex subunit G [Roseburia sp. MSJ-14]
MNKKIVHDALVLTAFTLILGFILGAVNEITKEPIAKANKAAQDAAYREVFKDADSFEDNVEFTAENAEKIIAKSDYTNDEIIGVTNALDKSGNVIGYVINVTSHEGSQADITFSVGIQVDGTVNGYSITSISETPGLGMLVNEDDFKNQFNNKNEESFSVVKTTPSADNEIEAVTGATISSRAITNGVNACLVYFNEALQGGN